MHEVNNTLALFTLVEIKFARKSTDVFHRLATQGKSTQVLLTSSTELWHAQLPFTCNIMAVFGNLRALASRLALLFDQGL